MSGNMKLTTQNEE